MKNRDKLSFDLSDSLYQTNRKKYFTCIEEEVASKMKKNRFRHTLGVAHTAACMAMRYDCDIDKAYLAGLLHDIAKPLEDDQMLKTAKRYGIEISPFEENNPFILHGKVAAAIAHNEYGIQDFDVLNSISYHTTGREDMSLLEKIIFLADYLECGREDAPDLPIVRSLAFQDIDRCLITVLTDTLEYLQHCGREIDHATKKTYDYYKNIMKSD